MRREIAIAMGVIFSVHSLFFACGCTAQESRRKTIMFWNVENFFDPFDDGETLDDDFTPDGKYRWTWKRFVRKRNTIAKVVLSTADASGSLPDIIGLAEVENRMVLRQVVQETPLAKLDYGIVHRDSPDRRGVDVALLYRRGRFKPLHVEALTVPTAHPTRDILHVCGIAGSDTLHILVNHWPSKLGGGAAASRRDTAAAVLSAAVRRIQETEGNGSRIIIMGDFNDTPGNTPIPEGTVNLATELEASGEGSIRFSGRWELIDQYVVSMALAGKGRITIFKPGFLLEEDKTYPGPKPKRTFIGPRYNGGVSDHLPILLLLDEDDDGQHHRSQIADEEEQQLDDPLRHVKGAVVGDLILEDLVSHLPAEEDHEEDRSHGHHVVGGHIVEEIEK